MNKCMELLFPYLNSSKSEKKKSMKHLVFYHKGVKYFICTCF